MQSTKNSEFTFIQRLLKKLPETLTSVITGAGDDAGVIKLTHDSYLLATTDSQVSGVHFLQDKVSPYDIGRKSVAVNVSDICAMGGIPTYCLTSFIFPKTLKGPYLDSLSQGVIDECQKYNTQIIGGNVSTGQELVVDLFLLGTVSPDLLLLRNGAKPGDKVLVTGTLGEAACGLSLALGKTNTHITQSTIKRTLLERQFTPTARLSESGVIAKLKLATSMIDISDGLGQDLSHITCIYVRGTWKN